MTAKQDRVSTYQVFDREVKMVVFKYAAEDLPLAGPRSPKNTETYVEWMVQAMMECVSEEDRDKIGSTKWISVRAFFASPSTCEKIATYVMGQDYLNWGPVTCFDLADDEYGIDVNQLVIERPYV